MEFEGLIKNAQSMVKSASIRIIDSTGSPSNIVEREKDWDIVLDLDFEQIPEGSHTVSLHVYLESMGGSEAKWSDKQNFAPQKHHYTLRVHIERNSVKTGTYRLSSVVEVKDVGGKAILIGYDEGILIEVYRDL